MKFSISLAIAVVLFSLTLKCQSIDEMQETRQMVQQTVDKFYSALEHQDWETMSSLYPLNLKVMAIGPARNDCFTGWDQIQQFWRSFAENKQALKIWHSDETSQINFTGNVAWFSSRNKMEFKIDTLNVVYQYFFTGVLKKIGGRWLWVQTHLSMPQENKFESDSLTTRSGTALQDTLKIHQF